MGGLAFTTQNLHNQSLFHTVRFKLKRLVFLDHSACIAHLPWKWTCMLHSGNVSVFTTVWKHRKIKKTLHVNKFVQRETGVEKKLGVPFLVIPTFYLFILFVQIYLRLILYYSESNYSRVWRWFLCIFCDLLLGTFTWGQHHIRSHCPAVSNEWIKEHFLRVFLFSYSEHMSCNE